MLESDIYVSYKNDRVLQNLVRNAERTKDEGPHRDARKDAKRYHHWCLKDSGGKPSGQHGRNSRQRENGPQHGLSAFC